MPPIRRTAPFIAALAALAALSIAPAHAGPTIERGFRTSFDDTPIVYNLFTPDQAKTPGPHPLIIQGHGWSGQGQKTATGFVKRMLDRGYAVLTFDSRGFGASGGEVELNSPAHEARDVSMLIDWAATLPQILTTAAGDPVVGMNGGSYAGGIQLAAAAFDPRIDAITPRNTWHDLTYSLFPGGVPKIGWSSLLYANGLSASTSDGLDPQGPAGTQPGAYSLGLHEAMAKGIALGHADDATRRYLLDRSVAGFGENHPIAIPTLLVQGLTDPIFRPNEALWTLAHLERRQVAAKLMLWCGGHGACPYARSGEDHVDDRVLDWFDRHLRGLAVDTGPRIEFIDNTGRWRGGDSFPGAADHVTTVTAAGRIAGTPAKTSATEVSLDALRATPSRAQDPGTLIVETPFRPGETLLGVPRATIRIDGAGPGVHLFLKLVDREANEVIGLQETALRVEPLTAEPRTVETDLVALAYRVPAGHHVDLHVSTSSSGMAEYRGASVSNLDIEIDVDTAAPASDPDPDPTPTPTPTPTGSPGGPPPPGPAPGTPAVLPTTLVAGFGRAPHADAPNTFVGFSVIAGVGSDGVAWGSFVVRDPIANGARATWAGSVRRLTIVGDTTVISGQCTLAGDPDAECTLTLTDVETPNRGADRVYLEGPGYREGNIVPVGEIVIQSG